MLDVFARLPIDGQTNKTMQTISPIKFNRFRLLTLACLLGGGVIFIAIMLGAKKNTPISQPFQDIEGAEQYALEFIEIVTQQHDSAQATKMLCADGFQYHKPNTDRQIQFWSSPEVLVPPHDFRVVKSLELSPELDSDYKVWVAFRYTYNYENQALEHNNAEGWMVYVTQRGEEYCISPWAGG